MPACWNLSHLIGHVNPLDFQEMLGHARSGCIVLAGVLLRSLPVPGLGTKDLSALVDHLLSSASFACLITLLLTDSSVGIFLRRYSW